PVNNHFDMGVYEVEVDMNNLASGIYFYKISAGAFSDIKKMILAK
ncbi:MAG: T9SS type A sorting domain-containing protein, partial [Ignavibacteriaceae bacterium]|nr:T9SS type A sorting domain-containing protein [Ignavibacteriaceae bacterium]